jgi:hypothetical protein
MFDCARPLGTHDASSLGDLKVSLPLVDDNVEAGAYKE